MHQHNCLGCKKQYQDSDPDPYYCTACQKVRKAVAAQVDAAIANRPKKRKTVSALQEYDNTPKVHGAFIQVHL